MIFNRFKDVAEKYPTNFALNDWTYRDLLNIIISGTHQTLSTSHAEGILIDILRASFLDQPLIILPKNEKENIEIPHTENKFSLHLYSSGSTGKRKSIKISESMLFSNYENSVKSQEIDHSDKILTVCSMNHTGGINAQSLPGLLTGCHVIVKKFNPYTFVNIIKEHNITITHLIPVMIDALTKLKNFNFDSNLKLVVAGSDCVKKDHAELFLKNKIPFMINYGLTEAGPIIINHKFKTAEELEIFDHGIPLGKNIWCDHKIIEKELHLRGKCVNTDRWLSTGDCVYENDGWFMYQGRISAGCKIVPKRY